MREFGIAGTAFDEGSLQLFHRGKDLVLGAQVKLINLQQSLIFEEKLLEISTEIGARRLEGVWYLPTPKTRVRLILSNTGNEAVPASVLIDGIAPKQKSPFAVTLNPHETRVFDAARDIGGNHGGKLKEVGGITVEHSSSAGALLARVLIDDAAAGYSSSLRFYDSQKAKSTKLHGAGVRLGEVGGEKLTPVIVARNTGDAPTRITGRIPYTTTDGQMGTAKIPAMRLARGETKIIETSAALKRSGIEQNIATAGLEFEYTGVAGSVVMSAQSMTKSGDHAFQVPLWDIEAQRSSTGGYPWKIEGGSSTFVYIKNVTDQPQQYTWELKHTGGFYAPGLKTVEAGQTVIHDIRELRDKQVADERGSVIPLDADTGQIHWSLRGGEPLALIGRSEQVDVGAGLSVSYACQNCCGDNIYDVWLEPGQIFNFIGESQDFQAMERRQSCFGNISQPFNNPYVTWSSSDWQVAECDQNGLMTARALGSATISAEWYVEIWHQVPPDLGFCEREVTTMTADAPVEVAPTIIIKQDGQDITGATKNVIVGQQINLTAQVMSGNSSSSNPQWSVPGNPIANYTASNMEGKVTPLEDLNNTSLSFYWVSGGDNRQVTYSVTVRGRAYSGRVTFNVKRPTVTVTARTGVVSVRQFPGEVDYELLCGVVSGPNAAPGIRFTRTNLMVPTGFSGDTYWVQLANVSRTRRRNDGTNETFTDAGLDTAFPYSSNDPNATETQDSPGLRLTINFNYATVNDSFQMWLMFKPSGDNSIFVPLRRVNWGWSGSAERPGTPFWNLVAGSSVQASSPADSTTHPTWTKRAGN
ncbi:MAG: Ig-like domain-containing protein [Pyrinomonadaceae bacterium MAG19_C2-C3]|nr:Ig-like domain-containing protein [Pyrinomonadaceae bacterium MAG19_C2-C3]